MFGTGELILILGAVLLLFGGKRLPEFAKSLGQGIREFKKACNGEEDIQVQPIPIDDEKNRKGE
ncbi:MAG: twin-arginine translocase TatA/TatE family subunit [Parachlamydiaceae bacterium]